jgi:hypothetical protein
MDAQKLARANELAERIKRLEGVQRKQAEVSGLGRSLPDHECLSSLSPDATKTIMTVIDADLATQLDEARQRFAAL